MDSVKSFLGKKPTKKVNFTFPSPKPTPASGSTKNAGNEIVKLLSGEKPPTSSLKKKC